ncbi:hypothetical protein [Serratia plymuthica]|uniref:hypothetical protein n=1 Tax=Serratia plymuthica TaxID=82996 RepID=UPI0005633358|nr:hypothetical protein [Serratia plymuthica]
MSNKDPYELETKILGSINDFFGPGANKPTMHASTPEKKSVRSMLIHFANYTSFQLEIRNVAGPFGRYSPDTSQPFETTPKWGYDQWLAEIDYDGTLTIDMDFNLIETPYSGTVDETTLPFSLKAYVDAKDADAEFLWVDGDWMQMVGNKELRLRHTIIEPGSDGRAILHIKIEQVGYFDGN